MCDTARAAPGFRSASSGTARSHGKSRYRRPCLAALTSISSAVLAHDPVADRKPQTGALARSLGGEERIEDARQMFRARFPARVALPRRARKSIARSEVADGERAARDSMASRAFRNRFRNTCCSLPGLPLMAGNVVAASSFTSTPDFCSWCSTRRQAFPASLCSGPRRRTRWATCARNSAAS